MINDDIKASVAEAIRSLGKDTSLHRLLTEEQQDITEYLKESSAKLIELAKAVTIAKTALEANTERLEQQAAKDKELFDRYNADFERLMKAGVDSAAALEVMYTRMEKEDALGRDIVAQLKERFVLEAELMEKIKLAEEAKIKREKEKAMLERIKTNATSNIGGMFGTLGIKFEGDPENMNILFVGLDKIAKGESVDAMNLMSFYLDKAGQAFSNLIRPLNIFVNMLGQIKTQFLEVFMEVDKVTANFMRATGASSDFAETITDAWEQTRGSNLSLQDMGDSVQSLMENYRGFTLQTKAAREEATVFNALVTRLGVDGASATKTFAYFADTLQLGVEGAKAAYSDLLGLVETTGETLNKVTSEFVSALPVLARYGNQAKAVFKQVFATAKALRIETAQLLEVTSHFDTYEDAATSVGKLNAIMGGPYLNAIQMMNQNEAERIETLNAAFKATGKSYDQLGKYGQMALATAAGITDMDLAQKVFTGSTADAARMMRQASLYQEELAEKNKRATTILDSWKNIIMQIGVVIQPLVDFAHTLLSAMLTVADAFGSIWEPLRALAIPLLFVATSAILGFRGVLVGLAKKIALSVAPGLGKLVSKLTDVTGVGQATADALKETGTKAVTATPAVTGLGKALGSIDGVAVAKNILLIGGAIAGVIALFLSLKDLATGLGGIFKGIGGIFEGIGQGFKDWLTESPLEELEDLINTLKEAGPDIGIKMKGVGEGMAALVEGFNKTVSQSTIESFTDLIDVLATNSSKFTNSLGSGIIDSYTKLLEAASIASITPTSIQNVKSLTENIVTASNGTPIITKNEKQASPTVQVKVYIDGKEMKKELVQTAIDTISEKLNYAATG